MRFLPTLAWPQGKAAGRIGTCAFAFLAFVVSLYWTFPEQVVSARLEQEVAKASNGQVTVRVAKAQLWRLSGLHAEDVTVRMGGQPPISVDSIRLRLRLPPLLLFRLSFYGQVQLEGGTLDVTATRRNKEVMDLHAELDNINLAKPAALGKLAGFPLAGLLTGEIDLEGVQDLAHCGGKVSLKATTLALGPGEIKGLGLPQLPLGDLSLAAEIADGTLQIKALRQEGGKINLTGGGKVTLNRTPSNSTLDVCFRLGADKAFLQENPKVATVMQLAQTQLKRDTDGMLNLPIQGPMGAPEVRPTLCPRR